MTRMTPIESFSRYYKTTLLSGETDPNKLYDLIADMESYQVFSDEHVELLVNRYLDGADCDQLDPALDACATVYKQLDTDGQIKFKSAVKGFVRTYGFLSAIFPYGNPEWEKLSMFLNMLIPKLPRVAPTYHRRAQRSELHPPWRLLLPGLGASGAAAHRQMEQAAPPASGIEPSGPCPKTDAHGRARLLSAHCQ